MYVLTWGQSYVAICMSIRYIIQVQSTDLIILCGLSFIGGLKQRDCTLITWKQWGYRNYRLIDFGQISNFQHDDVAVSLQHYNVQLTCLSLM